MKYIAAILIMTLFVASASGSEVDCGKSEKLVNLTTRTIAITLNCKNEMSLREDVDRLGVKLGLCKEKEEDKGLVCYIAAKGGVYLVQKQIPKRWMCKPDIAMKVLETTLNKVCTSITGL